MLGAELPIAVTQAKSWPGRVSGILRSAFPAPGGREASIRAPWALTKVFRAPLLGQKAL